MESEVKIADTDVDIHPLLKKRWSPRAFSDKIPDRALLHRLFEAARWAPSSANEQPWRFIVGIKDADDTWQKILNALKPNNQEWCQYAPVLVSCISSRILAKTRNENTHYRHDLGLSLGMLCVQATYEGVYVHMMAGFFPDTIKDNFELPDDFIAVTCAAIGYLGSPDKLSEKNRESETRKRSRRPLNETVFVTQFGKPFPFENEER